MAGQIQWSNDFKPTNNGVMCMDVNGFESASAPFKHVQLRRCNGNGNQQFQKDGSQIKWTPQPSNGWTLGVENGESAKGAKIIATPHGSNWNWDCDNSGNCAYQLHTEDKILPTLCITTPGHQNPSIQGYTFDLILGECDSKAFFKGASLAQAVASPVTLEVTGCAHATVGNIIRGSFQLHGENHGKPIYVKDGQVNGLSVIIYYWDERDGPAFCGWWFGPKVGGDQVWAYHANKTAPIPPQSGWQVPFDGPVDNTLVISYKTKAHATSVIV